MSPTFIAAYLALFTAVGFGFLFLNLLVGKFLRPKAPNQEKLSVYECGEPTIGSSFVQFDLRFYVVALLFIIFDVEIAFFFPWATVYGKATHLMDPALAKVESVEVDGVAGPPTLLAAPRAIYSELGVPPAAMPQPAADATPAAAAREIERSAGVLALAAILDILVFFGVLMVGFAYVWRRGDLDWVRAVGHERAVPRPAPTGGPVEEREPALAGS
ncbi:MAG: NADH-quinone oxidoreductase subunit A [Pirellulales bacterium]